MIFLPLNRCVCHILKSTYGSYIGQRSCQASMELISTTDDRNDRYLWNHKQIPKTKSDHNRVQELDVVQPDEPKLNRVAIIGVPNSGKSTLLNQLVGARVSSVSSKVHTTRRNVIGVLSQGSTQVEFLDTPGLIQLNDCLKHSLEHTLYHHPHLSAKVADMVVVLVDVSLKIYRRFLTKEIYNVLLKHRDKKSVLVLNKVDILEKKQKLMYCVDRLTGGYIDGESVDGKERRIIVGPKRRSYHDMQEIIKRAERKLQNIQDESKKDDLLDPNIDPRNLHWPYFSRVFMISALTGDGVDDLRSYLISEAKPQPWKYHESIITRESPENIICSIVREKFLDNCIWDIPYTLGFKIGDWVVDDLGNLHISVDVIVHKQNQMRFVVGGNGTTVSKVVDQARQELSDLFCCDVRLKINVKCTQRDKK